MMMAKERLMIVMCSSTNAVANGAIFGTKKI